MPFMAGVRIPTGGFLDFLSIEMEYWKNRYPIILVQALRPGLPKVDWNKMSPKIDISKPYDEDNLKWSISAQKSIGQYFTVNLQLANDHIRPIRYDFSPYPYETMLDNKAWYYLVRLQVNM